MDTGIYKSPSDIYESVTGSSDIHSLLSNYLQALANACKLGVLLAGKLDKNIEPKNPDVKDIESHSQTKRKDTAKVANFYSHILSAMEPLWKQTFCDVNYGSYSTDMASQNETSDTISKYLTELHKSMAVFSQSLWISCSAKTTTTQVSSSSSPKIVITGSTGYIEKSGRQQPLLEVGRDPSEIARSHVPTQANMDNLINFLSSTRKMAESCENAELLPVKSRNQKVNLGNQRSLPLPATGSVSEKNPVPSLASSIKHHSDWQLYEREQSLRDLGRKTFEQDLSSCGSINSDRSTNYNSPYIMAAWSSFPSSLGFNNQIWSHDPNGVSSNNEDPQATANQLYKQQSKESNNEAIRSKGTRNANFEFYDGIKQTADSWPNISAYSCWSTDAGTKPTNPTQLYLPDDKRSVWLSSGYGSSQAASMCPKSFCNDSTKGLPFFHYTGMTTHIDSYTE